MTAGGAAAAERVAPAFAERVAPAAATASPRLPLGRLGAIGLDALVGEAELLSRTDRKYLVPLADTVRMLERLDSRARVLEIDGRREFAYDSVYFDTPERLSYRLTAQRRRRRFKLRTRSYLDTGGAFLEVKTKSGRGATVKERMPYDPADRGRLTPEGRAYLAERLSRQGHDAALVERLRPVLVSRYRRATLLLPQGSRLTVDTELRWIAAADAVSVGSGAGSGSCSASGTGRRLHLDGYAIIESKSVGPAGEFDRALWRLGYRPGGLSKFGTGTAALHPELPSNKWARQLRGPFQTSTPNGEPS